MLILQLSVGCIAPADSARDDRTDVWLVDDGQHSALLMPREALAFDPLGDHMGESMEYPWVEVSLSEREWALGVDRSTLRTLRMLVDPGQAVITYEYHKSLDEGARGRAIRQLAWNRSMLTAWEGFIRRWSDFSHPVERLSGTRPLYFVWSTYPYSLIRNCRAFTAEGISIGSLANEG